MCTMRLAEPASHSRRGAPDVHARHAF